MEQGHITGGGVGGGGQIHKMDKTYTMNQTHNMDKIKAQVSIDT